MMLSPESYVNTLKDNSYEELLKERDKLIRELRYFEKHREELTKEVEICPSPETEYYWGLHYLAELMKLIIEKYDELEEE